ncbi:hypothetical protein HYX12_00010 [Candidatus Woesearchaeota archaeon]|nr:hypothetical protein [Candidatus Woesearchaeota archaeon]
MPIIHFGVWKHQEKEQTEVVYCTDEDRDSIHLTSQGIKDAEKIGKEGKLIASSQRYGVIHSVLSPFIRVEETNNALLRGAGYDPQAASVFMHRKQELSFYGIDWEHPLVPTIDNSDAVLQFAKDLYFPHGERAPCFARFVYGTLDGLLTGIDSALRESSHHDAPQFVSVGTHTYILDAFAAAVFGYIHVDVAKKRAHIAPDVFPGMYGRSDFITGEMLDSRSPRLLVRGKGLDSVDTTVVDVDDLKKMRDEAYRHTLMG